MNSTASDTSNDNIPTPVDIDKKSSTHQQPSTSEPADSSTHRQLSTSNMHFCTDKNLSQLTGTSPLAAYALPKAPSFSLHSSGPDNPLSLKNLFRHKDRKSVSTGTDENTSTEHLIDKDSEKDSKDNTRVDEKRSSEAGRKESSV